MRRHMGMTAAVVFAVAMTPVSGGWVVTTVEDVPEALVVGEPTTLVFTIRQHGSSLLSGREPTVVLQAPGAGWLARRVRVDARDLGMGRYEATFTPRDTGLAEIVVDADFMRHRIRLLPLPVVARGVEVAPLPPVDRGRHLFVAKGCVSCHIKRDDPVLGERTLQVIGPELSGRRLSEAYLRAKLEDPARNRVVTNQYVQMPDLRLRAPEINALVAYLGGVERVATP